MLHLVISLIVFGCVFGSAVVGLYLHKWLPEHHFSEDSINAIKLATGLIATIAALVLGLLISSAKGSFDTVNSDLVRNAVSIIRLDRTLEQYGPQTQDLRVLLKHNYSTWIDLLGSGDSAKLAKLDSASAVGQIEVFERKLAQLSPSSPAQAQLQTRALQISDDVFAARWLALLQKRGSIAEPPHARQFELSCTAWGIDVKVPETFRPLSFALSRSFITDSSLALAHDAMRSIRARISSTRHAVMRSPSLTGCG